MNNGRAATAHRNSSRTRLASLSASTSFLASARFTAAAMVSVTSNLQRVHGPGCAFPGFRQSTYGSKWAAKQGLASAARFHWLLHPIEAMKVDYLPLRLPPPQCLVLLRP